jgi:hypothetical protein
MVQPAGPSKDITHTVKQLIRWTHLHHARITCKCSNTYLGRSDRQTSLCHADALHVCWACSFKFADGLQSAHACVGAATFVTHAAAYPVVSDSSLDDGCPIEPAGYMSAS